MGAVNKELADYQIKSGWPCGMLIIICGIAFSLLPHSIHDLPDFISEIPLRRLIMLSLYFLVAVLLVQQIIVPSKNRYWQI